MLRTLLEEISIETPDKIAKAVYHLAEMRTADLAADEGGHGFNRNAIAVQVDNILLDVKARIQEILKQS